MKPSIRLGIIIMLIFVLLMPALALSTSNVNLSIPNNCKDIVCDSDGNAEFSLLLTNESDCDLYDVSLILESMKDLTDTESSVGEIAVISVNGVKEEEPSDYIWIDCLHAGEEMNMIVQFSFQESESDPVWIRVSLCDEEYCEITATEKRCTLPGNDIQDNELNVAGLPVLRIFLILIVLNAVLWTAVILTEKRRKNR